MTSPTGPGPLSVGSPAAVLAIVPHLLGFLPRKSLVIIGAGQPRGRIHVTFRFDLPDPPGPDATAAIAAHAAALLSRQELTMAIVIGYGPGPLVTPLTDAIRQAVAGTDLPLRDVLRVDEGRYWSYLCREPSCCPPEGVPFDTAAHPSRGDHGRLRVSGAQRPRRPGRHDRTRHRICRRGDDARDPPRRTDRRQTHGQHKRHRVTCQAASRHRRRPDGRAGRNQHLPGRRSDRALWPVRLARPRPHQPPYPRRRLGPQTPGHRHAHLRLWTDLTRHAQPGYIAAPASLLAFTAWQGGNGALANLALDRALADNPSYSMARLLRDVIDAGTPPSMARLPMTPEEVAASYSDADEQSVRQTGPCRPEAGDVDTDSIL